MAIHQLSPLNRRVMLRNSLMAGLVFRHLSDRGLASPAAPLHRDEIMTALETEQRHDGPFFVFVEMKGGWDTTQFCDPKDARISGADPTRTRTLGPFRIVDHGHWPEQHKPHSQHIHRFFENFGDALLQIDGVQTTVATHGFGLLELNTGVRQATGHPHFLAAVAGSLNPLVPLPYITNSEHMLTAGLVQAVPTLDMAQVRAILNPNALGDGVAVSAGLWEALVERLERRAIIGATRSGLASDQESQRKLALSQKAATKLNELASTIDELTEKGVDERFAFAIAAMIHKMTVGCQISYNHLDTHSDHFLLHPTALGLPFRDMNQAFNCMRDYGLMEKTTILIASEFGRTPYYGPWRAAQPLNTEGGKDHWKHSSLFLMGRGVQGGRRVGGTSDLLESLPLNFADLKPDPEGQILTLGHVHQAIRQFAGVSSQIEATFPLRVGTPPAIFSK